ncbi:MAG: M1 family aminopeptidase [Desulfobacterales bacterium]
MNCYSALRSFNQNRPKFLIAVSLVIFLLAVSVESMAFQAAHDLSVTLTPDKALLSGTDRIRIQGAAPGQLMIALNPGLQVRSLEIDGISQSILRKGAGLAVTLPATNPAGPIELVIRYEGPFQDEAPVMPVNTDNPGYGVSGTISPRGTLLLGGARWYPAILSARESMRLKVTAPEGISTVTAGRSLGTTTRSGQTISTWQIDALTERLALTAGRYVVTTATVGTVDIATYFLEDDPDLAASYLEATADYLSMYANQFGPYPFSKFVIVENFFPTGYGFPSFTLIGGRVLRLPFILRTSLGHEIAHCWWGNGVLLDASEGNWAEGLTSYVAEYQYQEMASPEAARKHRQQMLRNYATLVSPQEAFPLRRFSHRYNPVTKAIGYDKSAMIFHMLKQTIGKAAFDQGLRHLYATRLHKASGWDDLQKAFETVHGRDLSWFFDQWLDRPDAPTLRLEDLQLRNTAPNTYLVRGVLRQDPPFFRLAVPLTLSSETASEVQTVDISGASTPFEFRIADRPQRLEADPQTHVFRRLVPDEIPPSINALKREAPLLVVVTSERISATQKRSAELLARGLGRSEIIFQSEKNLDSDQFTTNDLVIMGIPRTPLLQDHIQARFRLSPEGFELDGKSIDADKNTFFGVWRHPQSPQGIMALLVHGSERHRETIVRKIPHYGRFSYLVFDETTNRNKGVWPMPSSPLVHVWRNPGS